MKVSLKQIFVISKRKALLSIIFGIFFSCCVIIGDGLYTEMFRQVAQFDKVQKVLFILKNVGIVVGSMALFWGLSSCEFEIKNNTFFEGKKVLLAGWGCMVVCYIPALISFLPGLLAYDTRWQTYQIYGIYSMTNHHPILHTYLWKLFLVIGEKFGSLEVGIMLYSIFQLLVLTFMFMIFVLWFGKNIKNKYLQVAAYLFFSLNPTFHLLIIQSDKDVLFGGCMLLWTAFLIDAIREKKMSPKLMIMTIFGSAFRHNGFYAILVMALLVTIVCLLRKSLREKYKGMLMSLFLGLIIYFVVLKSVLFIGDIPGASVREMLSVPCSQLANVYLNEVYNNEDSTLTEEEQQLIVKYIPNVESYNMRLADFVKGTFNDVAFEENPVEFIKLWIRCFFKYPVRYIYATLQLTIYYWCPTANDFPDAYSGEAYIQSVRRDPWDIILIEDWDCWPQMRNFYHSIGQFNNVLMRMPVISFCFSLSFPFFIIVFSLHRILYKKEFSKIIILLFPILYMCTLLVGPVCNYRYIFPLILQVPVFMSLIFINYNKTAKIEERLL